MEEARAVSYSRSAVPTGSQAQASPGLAGKGVRFSGSVSDIQQDSSPFWGLLKPRCSEGLAISSLASTAPTRMGPPE